MTTTEKPELEQRLREAFPELTDDDSNFQNWNGGKCDQFGSRSRLVWINDSAPSAAELASELDDKLTEILNARIENFKAEGSE